MSPCCRRHRRRSWLPPVELFTPAEELALSGFLAGYSGLTPRPTYKRSPTARSTPALCGVPGGR
jgi:hypothetical protein